MTESFWYYALEGQRHGPVPLIEIRSRAANGLLTAEDLVWTQGLASWSRAGSIPGLLAVVAEPAPLLAGPTPPAVPAPSTAAPITAASVPAETPPAAAFRPKDPPEPKRPVGSRRPRPPKSAPSPARKIPIPLLSMIALVVAVVLWIVLRPETGPSPGFGNPALETAAEPVEPSRRNAASVESSDHNRSRQQETVENIRHLGVAYMSWLADRGGGATPGEAKIAIEQYRYGRLGPAEITNDLQPSDSSPYIDEVLLEDGWGHPFEVWRGESLRQSRVILIRSPGRDGIFDGEEYARTKLDDGDYDADIVWADGHFIRWPGAVKTP